MLHKTKWYIIKLETPASKCGCGNEPCTHRYFTAKLQHVKGGRMGYVETKGFGKRWICEECREKLIGQISQKKISPQWHETLEEKETRQNG